MPIGNQRAIGDRPHRITLQNPGDRIDDGDGGFSFPWITLDPPELSVSIVSATAARLERTAAGTSTTQATHIISGPFHPQITTATRVAFNGRTFNVTGIENVDELGREMVLLCIETGAVWIGPATDHTWIQGEI